MKSLFTGVETEKYPTILIDEVQDYAPEWIKLVRDCFLCDGGEMVLFGDQSQNIYDRPSDDRASPIVKGFGEWIKLTKSYRSAGDAPLLQLFRNFQVHHLIRKYTDSEIFEAKAEQISIRYDLLCYETYGTTYNSAVIFEKIQRYIRENKLNPNDIAVVSSKVELLIPLNEALKRIEKTKGMFEEAAEVDVLAARMDRDSLQFREEIAKIRRRKKCFFMQNSGLIKMSTIHSFKGLEAQTVFCILTPEDEAEMVYTGITRAQKNLVVFDSSKSRFRSFFQTHMAVVDAPQDIGA
jgi:superfamily I DNA/RNA helicase